MAVLIQFSSGKDMWMENTYAQMGELLEEALASGKLLELTRFDGTTVLINPNNVDFLFEPKDP